MAYQRPTLSDLINQSQRDFEATLTGTDARIAKSLINVIARAHAGALHEMYGYLENIRDNALLIDPDDDYVDLLASRWNLQRRTNTFANGYLVVIKPASNIDGMPKGIVFTDSNGRNYFTTETVQFNTDGRDGWPISGHDELDDDTQWTVVGIQALDSGISTLGEWDVLTARTQVPEYKGFLYAPLQGGEIEEFKASLLDRLFARWQRPPMGGTLNDYEQWAIASSPDITRAWAVRSVDANSSLRVTVYIASDNGDVESVTPNQNAINQCRLFLKDKVPVVANYQIQPVVGRQLPIHIYNYHGRHSLDDFKTLAVKASVDFLRREAVPGQPLRRSRLGEAISAIPGENYFDFSDSNPARNFTPATNEIFYVRADLVQISNDQLPGVIVQ